jgi:hypothetical protein
METMVKGVTLRWGVGGFGGLRSGVVVVRGVREARVNSLRHLTSYAGIPRYEHNLFPDLSVSYLSLKK